MMHIAKRWWIFIDKRNGDRCGGVCPMPRDIMVAFPLSKSGLNIFVFSVLSTSKRNMLFMRATQLRAMILLNAVGVGGDCFGATIRIAVEVLSK